MSREEFDRADEQVIGLVNENASRSAAAEVCPDPAQKAQEDAARQERRKQWIKNEIRKMEAAAAAEKSRRLWQLLLKVFACAVAECLFFAAIIHPMWVAVVCGLGVLTSAIVAAICIDRYFWR